MVLTNYFRDKYNKAFTRVNKGIYNYEQEYIIVDKNLKLTNFRFNRVKNMHEQLGLSYKIIIIEQGKIANGYFILYILK